MGPFSTESLQPAENPDPYTSNRQGKLTVEKQIRITDTERADN